MIDATKITDFNRSDYELEEFFLFSIFVAGKTASIIEKKLEIFLEPARKASLTPLQYLKSVLVINESRSKSVKRLSQLLKKYKMGRYDVLSIAMYQIITEGINLRTCTVDDLENIHGIGPKTSRFFIMHSRQDTRVAALDTHILSWLKMQGYTVPKSTPSGRKYKFLESIFLQEADKRNISPHVLDLDIWNTLSIRSGLARKSKV